MCLAKAKKHDQGIKNPLFQGGPAPAKGHKKQSKHNHVCGRGSHRDFEGLEKGFERGRLAVCFAGALSARKRNFSARGVGRGRSAATLQDAPREGPRGGRNFISEGCKTMRTLANFTAMALMLVCGAAVASPGATDASGCHTSARHGYHCHAKKPGKATERQAGKRRTAEDRRLRRECKGRPNAGACLGYAS